RRDRNVTGVQTCALPILIGRYQITPLVKHIRIHFEYTLHLSRFHIFHPDIFNKSATAMIGFSKEKTEYRIGSRTIVHVHIPYTKNGRASCRERVQDTERA